MWKFCIYHRYEAQNKETFPQLVEELAPMSEVDDHYIGAEILLPREDIKMSLLGAKIQN